MVHTKSQFIQVCFVDCTEWRPCFADRKSTVYRGRATRADMELDATVEGSLAAEVAMIVLDTLEHIVQVSTT